MPYLTDLADACRKSGLTVVEVPGWETRGHGPMSDVLGIVAHHTATSNAASGDYPSLRVVRDGHSSLPGPLSQLGLGRSGTVYVIAAGRCYHAGPADSIAYTNSYAIGIEAEDDGYGQMPDDQYDAYVRLCKALDDHYGTQAVRGHKEIAVPPGRKVDPVFDMSGFRRRVAGATAAQAVPTIKATRATIAGMQRGIASEQYPLDDDGEWGPKTDYASKCLRAYLADPHTDVAAYRSRGWHRLYSPEMGKPKMKATIRHMQWRLGLPKEDRDGIWGPQTEGAWRAFEKAAKAK